MSLNHSTNLRILFLKITQLSPWEMGLLFGHFFASFTVFVRYHFCGSHICLFRVEVLSCAIFVRYHYFQMALKGAIFVGCV